MVFFVKVYQAHKYLKAPECNETEGGFPVIQKPYRIYMYILHLRIIFFITIIKSTFSIKLMNICIDVYQVHKSSLVFEFKMHFIKGVPQMVQNISGSAACHKVYTVA